MARITVSINILMKQNDLELQFKKTGVSKKIHRKHNNIPIPKDCAIRGDLEY